MRADHHETEQRLRQALQFLADDTPVRPRLEPARTTATAAEAPGRGRAGSRARPRTRLVVSLAAALSLVGGAAVAAGVFDPDPEDVASIVDAAVPDYDGFDRTPTLLSASVVWCAYADGTVGPSSWHDLPLDEAVTERHLVQACADGPDAARFGEIEHPPTDGTTLCEGTVPAAETQRHLEAHDIRVVEGDPAGQRPSVPVVLGWDGACGDTTLPTDPAIQLRPLHDLTPTNQTRQVEIHLRAAAIDECLTRDRVLQLAVDAQAALPGAWVVVDSSGPDTTDVACWSGVRVDALRGLLDIAGAGG